MLIVTTFFGFTIPKIVSKNDTVNWERVYAFVYCRVRLFCPRHLQRPLCLSSMRAFVIAAAAGTEVAAT